MKYQFDYMKKNNYNVSYVEYKNKPNVKSYTMFDPVDKIKLFGDVNILENPNFIIPNKQLKEYRNKTDNFIFNNFYNWNKKN